MIVSITAMSFLLIVSGFVTNFEIIYNHQEIFTPIGSLSEQHYQWITQQSGFQQIRPFYVMVHKDGNNVLANATSTIQTVFDVISVLETTPGYDNVCTPSTTTTTTTSILCPWSSPTQYWNHSKKIFHDELQLFGGESEEEQNEYVIRTLSQSTFPDKTPVFHEALLGNYEYQQEPPTVVDDDDDNGDDDNDDTFTTFDISNTSTKMNNSNATSVRSLQSTSQTLLRPSQETTTTITIVSAQSYTVKIDLPNLGIQSEELEQRMLMRMNDMMQQQSTLSSIKVEYFTMYAYTLEFEKAVYSDIYLVFVMILIMVTFCCGVFWNRQDRIQSRSMVGLFSITTIGMSLLSGYGLMWLLAVPFTNISMMVPFVIMGIGLDDTFIITGAYFRCRLRHQHDDHKNNQRASSVPATNNSRDNDTDNNRRNIGSKKGQQDLFLGTIIAETMDEVGLSICLTTITTMVAFALGIIISSIPAVRWLCIYGFTCIGIDFIYQITFFVALLVMDEKRIMANRYDCCWWTVQPEEEQDNDNGENDNVVVDDHQHEHEHEGDDVQRKNRVTENKSISPEATNYNSKCDNDNENNNKNFSERFMGWYADQLLRPITKACVLTFFTVFLGGCVFSTTLLTQEFKVESYVPRGSHVKTFFESFENYSSLFQAIGVYFRDVDQSDPVIQQQMMDYVANLSQMQQIGGEPPQFFWLRDFADTMSNAAPDQNLDLVANMTFEQRMDFILSIPEVSTVYGKDIVRDPTTGEITASRCFLHLRNIDMDSVPDQIDTLLDQRVITRAQPINDKKNQGAPRFSFFTFDDLYFYWELYAASIDELIFTIITGAVAVSAVAFVLIPHWSATLFVTPLIIALYFMLLGKQAIHSYYYFLCAAFCFLQMMNFNFFFSVSIDRIYASFRDSYQRSHIRDYCDGHWSLGRLLDAYFTPLL